MMTAAMAFFSITMTLSITGVRLTSLRPSAVLSLPSVVRSFTERRLTMASTPIVRYYDHSRLVYEVQARMRELRRGQDQEEENRRRLQEPAPGESKQSPGRKNRNPWGEPPQQTMNLAMATKICGAAHSGDSTREIEERNTEWTA